MKETKAISIIMDKIHKKPECLSIWNSSWYTLYYAFNGNPKKEKRWDKDGFIPKMYKKSQQVYYSDSYTRYVPIPNYQDDVSILAQCDCFSYKLSSVGTYNLWKEYKPGDSLYLNHQYNRNWTCAERKILGFIKDNYKNIKKPTIYTTKYPCKLCLPELKHFIFYDYEDNTIVKGKTIINSDDIMVINKR